MKQFFTLVLFVFFSLSAEAQVGTIYRLNSDASASTNGTSTTGFLRSNIWTVVSSPNALLIGTNQIPTSGATLQIFGNTLTLTGTIDLSNYVFNIQIRSEGISATFFNIGILQLGTSTLSLAANSTITLGWDIATFGGTTYFYPGYIRLAPFKNNEASTISIGAIDVANFQRTGGSQEAFLNSNAYNVNAPTGAQYNLAVGAPSSTHIMSGANTPNANITNKTVARVGGALFTQFAYFYNPISGAGGSAVAPLPVQLISFNATKTPGKVVLNWATAQEINSDYFEVQRSTDASNWTTVTTVKAAGNSGNVINYKADDAAATAGNVYYRIKMVDKDATYSLSNIARLSFAAANSKLFAYPNPASNYTVINSDQNLTGKIQVEVVNYVSGVRMMQQVLTNPGNSFRLNMSQLPAGNYVVRIYSEENLLQVLKLAKF